jgi:cell shape-determining protein MreC
MTYLQDKKRKRDLYFKVFSGAVLAALFLFGATYVVKFLSPLAYGVFGNGGKVLRTTSDGVTNAITTKASLQDIVRKLEDENQTLKTKEEIYNIQEKEIVDLRQALALKDEGSITIFTKVISARSVYGTFLLANSAEGTIKEGDSVVDKLGNGLGLVGRVDRSVVTVLSYDSLKVPLQLNLLNSEITVEALKMSRAVLVAKVPRETMVEVGDIAVSPDNQIKVGVVIDYSKDEKDPFKEIYIRMSGKIENGAVVGIVHNK